LVVVHFTKAQVVEEADPAPEGLVVLGLVVMEQLQALWQLPLHQIQLLAVVVVQQTILVLLAVLELFILGGRFNLWLTLQKLKMAQ
jgi:hypothetical protein